MCTSSSANSRSLNSLRTKLVNVTFTGSCGAGPAMRAALLQTSLTDVKQQLSSTRLLATAGIAQPSARFSLGSSLFILQALHWSDWRSVWAPLCSLPWLLWLCLCVCVIGGGSEEDQPLSHSSSQCSSAEPQQSLHLFSSSFFVHLLFFIYIMNKSQLTWKYNTHTHTHISWRICMKSLKIKRCFSLVDDL